MFSENVLLLKTTFSVFSLQNETDQKLKLIYRDLFSVLKLYYILGYDLGNNMVSPQKIYPFLHLI